MTSFCIRNLKVFFKDKSAVFFSLLAVFIIIGLYALFLGDTFSKGFDDIPGARYLIDSWIVAGLLAVTSVTTTMGAFEIMVQDKENRINKDFVASPVKNRSIVGGYIFGAIIIGIIMSLVALVLTEIYLIANGGELMSIPVLIKVIALIVLSTITNSALILFMVSFFKSINAFTTASTIIGTLIGFLTGIYLPIGQLPETIQWLVKCFPVSHAAALLRQVIMRAPMEASFGGTSAETAALFEQFMGVRFDFNGTIATPLTSILILLGTAAAFYALSVVNLSRKEI